MAKKKPANKPEDTSEKMCAGRAETMERQLAVASKLIKAQEDLLVCYRLKRPRVRAVDAVTKFKEEWAKVKDAT